MWAKNVNYVHTFLVMAWCWVESHVIWAMMEPERLMRMVIPRVILTLKCCILSLADAFKGLICQHFYSALRILPIANQVIDLHRWSRCSYFKVEDLLCDDILVAYLVWPKLSLKFWALNEANSLFFPPFLFFFPPSLPASSPQQNSWISCSHFICNKI